MPYHPSYKNKNGKEIDLHVLVYTRPNLRDDGMLTHIGYNVLENLFDKLELKPGVKKINIVFPERWTNILEQRALVERIPVLYPDVEEVRITTHSVYIIQCTQACQIGICDDATKYPEKNYSDPNTRYCPKEKPSNGIMTFGG